MAEFDRFRSFAERYVIERAASFTRGSEQAEAWAAILDAKTIYRSIGSASRNADVYIDADALVASNGAQQTGANTQAPPPGATGAYVSPGPAQYPQQVSVCGTPIDELDMDECKSLVHHLQHLPSAHPYLGRLHQRMMSLLKGGK